MLQKLARRPTSELVGLLVVFGAAFFVFLQLHPELLFVNTTPAGGDMGAHVWGPAFMRDNLLGQGQLSGWTKDWYGGFPAIFFYFPLPYFLIVALDLVLPYGVAFKLVVVSGLVAMPVCAYVFGRCLRLPRPAPELLALATLGFLFDTGGGSFEFRIYGGNIASTMAGEFAFAVSLCFSLVFLGSFANGLRTGRRGALTAILFALTLTSHLIPTFFAIAGAVVLTALHLDWLRLRFALVVGAIGSALTAIWFLPFALRLAFTNDMGWEKNTEYLKGLFPPDLFFHSESKFVLYRVIERPVAALAFVGLVLALRAREKGALSIATVGAVFATAFVYLPNGRLWNNRLLPFWYLCLWFLAAYAIAEIVRLLVRAAERRTANRVAGERWLIATPVIALGFTLVVLMANLRILPAVFDPALPKGLKNRVQVAGQSTPNPGGNFVSGWTKWNFEGYERKESYADYKDMIETMRGVGKRTGCGRAMWEYEPALDRYGTPMAPMLLPYWTEGCIGSMEGLYFESSPSVAFHFMNQADVSKSPSSSMRNLPYGALSIDFERGIDRLQLSGVRYYMATTPEAQQYADGSQQLKYLTQTKEYSATVDGSIQQRRWKVYFVKDAELVTPLTHEPVVNPNLTTKERWLEVGVNWYQNPPGWIVPIVDDGPKRWSRVRIEIPGIEPGESETPGGVARRWGDDVKVDEAPIRELPKARVTKIRETQDSISFHVDRVGVPVLVKTSYFPNWRVKGGEGPYRSTPNFMVVVPTSHDVTLTFGRTSVDYLGIALTLLGVVGLFVVRKKGDDWFPTEEARESSLIARRWIRSGAPVASVSLLTAERTPESPVTSEGEEPEPLN